MNNEYQLPLIIFFRSCGGGEKERTRHVEINADFGGELCSGALREITECNQTPCEDPVDCVWSEWQDWSACSKTCGGGQRKFLLSFVTYFDEE